MKKTLILFLFTLFISTVALAQQPSEEQYMDNLEQVPDPRVGFTIEPHVESVNNNGIPEIPNVPRNFFPMPVHTPEINNPEIPNTEPDIGTIANPETPQAIQVSEDEHTPSIQKTQTLNPNSSSETLKTYQSSIAATGCSLSLFNNTKPCITALLWLSSLSLFIIFKKFKKTFN